MLKTRGQYIWINGSLLLKENFKWELQPLAAYEVLRIKGNIPLFFHEHIERLKTTIEKSGISKHIDYQLYYQAIEQLCSMNGFNEGNVEIIETQQISLVRFIPHRYPTPHDYEKGVKVGYFYAERSNPSAKLKNNRLRRLVDRYLKRKNIYEALLVTSSGYVTEGSRSNVFFIDSDKVITAPESMVLKGITRQIILDLCRKNGIHVEERPILKSEISVVSLKVCNVS